MGKLLISALFCLFAAFITVEAQTYSCQGCHCPPCEVTIGGVVEVSDGFVWYEETPSGSCSETTCDTWCEEACLDIYPPSEYPTVETTCETALFTNPPSSCGYGFFCSTNACPDDKKRAVNASEGPFAPWSGVPWKGKVAEEKRDAETYWTPFAYTASAEAEYDGEAPDYLGCFTDESSRDLTGPVKDPTTGIQDCIRFCSGEQYPFAGIQDAIQCYCGTKYGTYGVSLACTNDCSGPQKRAAFASLNGTTSNITHHLHPANQTQVNSSEFHCGGDWANDVWTTGIKGCWTDSASSRDLSYVYSSGDSSMTVTKCRQGCQSVGYVYAGLQQGNQCYCGNHYGTHGQSANNCNTACSGDSTQKCGGSLTNIVFTALEFPPS